MLDDKLIIKTISEYFDYPSEDKFYNNQKIKILSIEVNIISLQQEYVRIFINSYPTLLCPPYASYYLEGIINGLSTLKIEELYSKYGFKPKYGVADFISIELEFLYILLTLKERLTDKYKTLIDKDICFMLEHLTYWTKGFFEGIMKNSRVKFYKKLAEITKIFLSDIKKLYAAQNFSC